MEYIVAASHCLPLVPSSPKECPLLLLWHRHSMSSLVPWPLPVEILFPSPSPSSSLPSYLNELKSQFLVWMPYHGMNKLSLRPLIVVWPQMPVDLRFRNYSSWRVKSTVLQTFKGWSGTKPVIPKVREIKEENQELKASLGSVVSWIEAILDYILSCLRKKGKKETRK